MLGCSSHHNGDSHADKSKAPETVPNSDEVNEANVLAIAKREVANRETWGDRAKYDITFDKQQWNVVVWRLPETPGGCRYISIDHTGAVVEYTRGL